MEETGSGSRASPPLPRLLNRDVSGVLLLGLEVPPGPRALLPVDVRFREALRQEPQEPVAGGKSAAVGTRVAQASGGPVVSSRGSGQGGTPPGQGGENHLLDHEIAYLMLRDENTDFIRALSAADAMTIPERIDDQGVARAAQSGPVFSVDSVSGALHMRYTARTRSIAWKQDATTLAAVAALEKLLASDLPHIHGLRLEPGMGLLCNNVLHDRAAFDDDAASPRLLYRARYHERIAAS